MATCRNCQGTVSDRALSCPHCGEADPVGILSPKRTPSKKKLAAHPFVVVQFASLIAFWSAYAINGGAHKISTLAIGTFAVTFLALCLVVWKICSFISWEVQEKYLYPISAFPVLITFIWAIFW